MLKNEKSANRNDHQNRKTEVFYNKNRKTDPKNSQNRKTENPNAPLLKSAKRPFPVDVRRSKTSLLKLPNDYVSGIIKWGFIN